MLIVKHKIFSQNQHTSVLKADKRTSEKTPR